MPVIKTEIHKFTNTKFKNKSDEGFFDPVIFFVFNLYLLIFIVLSAAHPHSVPLQVQNIEISV